jgi:hypothetical protein
MIRHRVNHGTYSQQNSYHVFGSVRGLIEEGREAGEPPFALGVIVTASALLVLAGIGVMLS